MKGIITTTPKGGEGFNISYATEQRCGKELLKVLPEGWVISFNWCQILFSDVEYKVDKVSKSVEINYNQNLSYWWKEVMLEIAALVGKTENE